MPAYHSAFNEVADLRSVGGMALLPIKTRARGPAPIADPNEEDIIDEALNLFRANVLFRNFEIKGDADRVLIYLILYITECLGKLTKYPSQREAEKILGTLAVSNFSIPGDVGFPLNALYPAPANKMESDLLRQYLTQVRQEMAARLPNRIYENDKPGKWWMCFHKRKFMNKSL
ncbi:subunit of the Arp2/3 complex [Lunasporangiospora selenospora]|uniref:Actin-related protein 2/3 complex subunit 3 n=1 Tax=Lunasporangiospora selenospora TaxID=979761 RepID=A0A9P6KEP0_9FUNG|nr:subunit of the Arp2/3 complex [Lunasporangiospora selenospora]